jgi:hypothetical protein
VIARLLPVIVLIGVLAVGCGGGAAEPDAATPEATPTPTATATPAPTAPPTSTVLASPVLTDAAPPREVPDLPGGASGFTHFVFERVGDDVITSLVEGPRGPQVRVPLSLPDLRDLLASEDPIPAELQMTRGEVETLVAELEEIRVATERYRDISVALGDGYVQTTNVVPNMGAHFNHSGRIRDGRLVLSEPEILMYDRDPDGAWRLIGVSFVLPYQLAGDTHPQGFTGPLDNWHMHYALCTGTGAPSRAELDDEGFIRSGTASAEGCRESGGTFVAKYGWMIHAWVHDDNPLGVFSMWNPSVPPLVEPTEIRPLRERIGGADGPVVTIENFALGAITVQAGESVTWLNSDGVPHTVTAADTSFGSQLIGPGQTYALEFDTPGTFQLFCTIHPSMNGTVIVE